MTCWVQVISPTQMAKGFRRVLDSVADLRLDVPEAPQQIAAFIARAIADDVLQPAFVEDIPAGVLFTSSPEPSDESDWTLHMFCLFSTSMDS